MQARGICRHIVGGKQIEARWQHLQLISVVEDDQPFRESMRKLMTSLGYAVEAFPSAADFLASPLLTCNRVLGQRRSDAWNDGGRAPQTLS